MLCARQDCPVERTRRAMEAWRAEQAKQGYAKSFAENDYWITCAICARTPGWRRFADGTVKALTKDSAVTPR